MAVSSPTSAQSNENYAVSPQRQNTHIISYPGHKRSSAGVGDGRQAHDSDNGKTCHQCRHKTLGVFSSCNNKDRKCSTKFCRRCLLNRYGEKAEKTAVLKDWKCPKCRGVCNCSICMKKMGHQPTGVLVKTAKATGFSSVLEMLQRKATTGVSTNKNVKISHASPDKSAAACKASLYSPSKYGKENSSLDPNVHYKPSPNDEEVKLKGETGWEKLKTDNAKHNAAAGSNKSDGPKKNVLEAKVLEKKHVNPIGNEEKVVRGDAVLAASNGIKLPDGEGTEGGVMTVLQRKRNLMLKSCTMRNNTEGITSNVLPESQDLQTVGGFELSANQTDGKGTKGNAVALGQKKKNLRLEKRIMRNRSEDIRSYIPLPECRDLLTVGGVELSANDIGPALQFLEFCGAFKQVLDLKKGHPEAVLRELTRGRVGRCGVYSAIVQFFIKLLSILQEDLGEEPRPEPIDSGNSWLQALRKYIAESQFGSKQFSLDCFSRPTDWYNKLDSSEKLRLLNFLCDEALGTDELRNWIDEEQSKYVEAKKGAKVKVLAAKEKEKLVKTKLKAEIAEALFLSNGALSVSEHENLISKMRTETEKARAEKLEAMAEEPKKNQTPDALRTESVLLDGDGHIHWRLRGYSDRSRLVLQDIGKWDSVMPQDKWFIYDDDQQKAVESYISLRKKRKREEAHVVNSRFVRKMHSVVAA